MDHYLWPKAIHDLIENIGFEVKVNWYCMHDGFGLISRK